LISSEEAGTAFSSETGPGTGWGISTSAILNRIA
jgi:hypothetical protein